MLKERSAILSEDYISGRASMSRDEERRSRGVRLCTTLHGIAAAATTWANVTSSIKPGVHNVSQRRHRHRTTEPSP